MAVGLGLALGLGQSLTSKKAQVCMYHLVEVPGELPPCSPPCLDKQEEVLAGSVKNSA